MKIVGKIYILLTTIYLIYVVNNIIACYISLKYDLDPGYLMKVPLEELFILAMKDQIFILKIHFIYIVVSLFFGIYSYIYSKKAKM